MSGFRSRGRGRVSGGRHKGSFTDNTWHCDCSPPLPAVHLKVKKETENKGRWFYKCQKQEKESCGFFLWEDDARPREEAAVRANPLSEPRSTSSTSAPTVAQPSGLPPSRSSQAVNPAKRKLQMEADGEEDELGWRPEASNEEETNASADNSRYMLRPPEAFPSTPRKANKATVRSTPGDPGNKLLTPLSHCASGISSDITPSTEVNTPSRYIGIPGTPRDRGVEDSLVSDVMHLLSEHSVLLSPGSTDALQQLLQGHSLRTQSLVRGRDIARLSVNEKNAEIKELEAKIDTLTAKLETREAVIKNLTWQKETGQFH